MSSDRRSFGVVIATYNGGEVVRLTIESVLGQTRPPDEVIVVDDGSTDDTVEIIAEFAPDVRVVRQRNAREHVARNRGLALLTTDFATFIDQDDLWHAGHLQAVELAHERLGADVVLAPRSTYFTIDPSLAAPDVVFVRDESDLGLTARLNLELEPTRIEQTAVAERSPSGTVVASRELLIAAGGYATTAPGIGEYLLMATLLRLAPVYRLGPTTHFYRQHEAMSSKHYQMASSLIGARLFLALSGSVDTRRQDWNAYLLRDWLSSQRRGGSVVLDMLSLARLLRVDRHGARVLAGALVRGLRR